MSDRPGPLAECVRAAVRSVARPADTDADLLAAFVRARDPAAFEQLVRRHGPLVRSACRHFLPDPADADDACQATFVVLYRKAHTVRAGRTLGGWLFRVARRAAIEVKRSGRRRRECEARAVRPETVAGPDLSWREAVAILHEELDRLPDKYRLPLIACYLEGKTQDEAARELAWPAETLRGRIDRGRAKLGERLRKRGVTLSAGLLAAAGTASVAPAINLPMVLSPSPSVAALARAIAESASRAWAAAGVMSVAAILFTGLMTLEDVTGSRAPKAPEDLAKGRAPEQREVRFDAHGDPLPDGAVARLGTVRFNHGDGLKALLYTPDGKTIVSVGYGLVRVWDADSAAEILRFPVHEASWDEQAAVTLDGKTLVLYQQESMGDPLRTYELATGKEMRKVTLPIRRGMLSVDRRNALSPDGRLAVTNTPNTWHVFDTETGKELWRMPRSGADVRDVTFAGPELLVAAHKDRTIDVWEARTGKLVRSFEHGDPAEVIEASPDGKLLATLGHDAHSIDDREDKDAVQIWDLGTGKRVRTLEDKAKSWLTGLTFTADGQSLVTVASTRDGGRMILWVPRTGARVWEADRKSGHVLAASPDGKRLAVGAGPGQFRLLALATGRPADAREAAHVRAPGVHLDATGGRAVTAGYSALGVWDATTGRQLHSLDIPYLGSVGRWRVVSPDGRWAVTPGRVGERTFAHVWNVTALRELYKLPMGGEYFAGTFAFSPDSARLAVRQPGTDQTKDPATITVRDVRTGKELVSFPDPRTKWWGTMFFTADGRTLVVAGHRVVGYAVADGKELFSYRVQRVPNPSPVGLTPAGGGVDEPLSWRGFALSPDGSLAACVLSGLGIPPLAERLLLCDGRTGQVLRRWSDSGSAARNYEEILFSPDGRLIASSDGADVRLWEAATSKEVRTFRGHRNDIESLAFSGNGRRLASGSWDSTVLIWDLSAPAAGDPEKWWTDLLSDDAAKGYAAVWRLADAADDVTMPLLRQHLRPATAADMDRVRKAVADLDSDQFRVRARAFKVLSDQGHHAAPALRAASDGKVSAEGRNRIEQLLAKVVGPPSTGEALRTWRALAALEASGTTGAKQLLRELADGAAGAWLTDEARALLRRVEGR